MKHLPLSNTAFKYVEKSFGEWLDILGYSPQTVYYLPLHIREFLHWLEQQGHTQLHTLTLPLIKDYYDLLKARANQRKGGGLSSAYLNKHLQALTKFTDYLRQVGRLDIGRVPVRWEEKDRTAITVLTIDEIRQMYRVTYDQAVYQSKRLSDRKMEALQSRDRALLAVFYGCGLRRNEGHHLDIGDINFDRQLLYVRKGKGYKERYVPFGEQDSKTLQEYIYDHRPELIHDKRENAFFISYKVRRMGGQSLLLCLKQLQYRTNNPELIEKEIGLHTLRHSIATHLLQAGMSLENISRFLGHSSLESTQVYTHLAGMEQERKQPYHNIPTQTTLQLSEDERI